MTYLVVVLCSDSFRFNPENPDLMTTLGLLYLEVFSLNKTENLMLKEIYLTLADFSATESNEFIGKCPNL